MSVEPGASGSSDRANRAHVARSVSKSRGSKRGAGAVANFSSRDPPSRARWTRTSVSRVGVAPPREVECAGSPPPASGARTEPSREKTRRQARRAATTNDTYAGPTLAFRLAFAFRLTFAFRLAFALAFLVHDARVLKIVLVLKIFAVGPVRARLVQRDGGESSAGDGGSVHGGGGGQQPQRARRVGIRARIRAAVRVDERQHIRLEPSSTTSRRRCGGGVAFTQVSQRGSGDAAKRAGCPDASTGRSRGTSRAGDATRGANTANCCKKSAAS